jgi:transcriptional regulator with XRE-family HTH domain
MFECIESRGLHLTTAIDLHIGRRLRQRRKIIGFTQKQLAAAVGGTFQQIQKYECGSNKMTASQLYRIAKALELSPCQFYDGLEGLSNIEAQKPETGELKELLVT